MGNHDDNAGDRLYEQLSCLRVEDFHREIGVAVDDLHFAVGHARERDSAQWSFVIPLFAFGKFLNQQQKKACQRSCQGRSVV